MMLFQKAHIGCRYNVSPSAVGGNYPVPSLADDKFVERGE